ncbi:MAG: alpha/beta hydrolase [Anaerolineae bacterium]|nr:alpha/beta hydrolase [Anaerolineae bacterium]
MPKLQRGNVELHYELDGQGAPVVYISGFGSHSNDMLSAGLRHSISQQYRVLTVDNRGSGQTVVSDGGSVTLEDMADDIAAVMEHHGIGAAHVLGISMGGCIAMLLALRHPAKVHSLIPAVSLPNSNMGTRSEFLLRSTRLMRDQQLPREIINRFNAVYLLSDAVFQYERFMDAWVNAPDDPLRQSRAGFDQQIQALEGYDIREALQNIHVPTLVMSSPDDILVPPSYQDEIAKRIPGAQMKRYPGGHVFMLLPMYNQQFMEDVFAFWAENTLPLKGAT